MRRLIQDDLGCGCPEEVFEQRDITMREFERIPTVRMIVGNRLLVWLIQARNITDPAGRVPLLLKTGRLERERLSLNRFRLVLVGHLTEPEARICRAALKDLDDRVHVHFIPDF